MIASFRSKALRLFAGTGRPPTFDGSARKLPVPNARRVRQILLTLDRATAPEDMNLPGLRFHGLAGQPKRYAVDASGNYRITFGWDAERGAAVDVDLEDYH